MQSRICLGIALLLTIYAYWLGGAEHNCFSQAVTAGLALSALLSVVYITRGWSRLREISAIVLLLSMAGMVVSHLVGLKLLSFDPFHDPRYAI